MTAGTRVDTFRLDHAGSHFELSARRDGLRTHVTLLRDGDVAGEVRKLGAALIPVDVDGGGTRDPDADGNGPPREVEGPTVVVLTVLPGIVNRALLLVPRPPADPADPEADGDPERARPGAGPPPEVLDALPKPLARFAAAARYEFAPPPGSVAARLAAFRRDHPGLWASRHVLLAVAKVALGVLGVSAFIRLLVMPLLGWLRRLLPDIDLPAIPWPDIDLPDIPWPDIDLPDLHAPGWLLALLGTAKFWAPILVAIGLAVVEIRRRRRAAAREDDERRGPHG